jgi:hypothetical protein
VTRQRRVVGKNRLLPDHAIVGDVRVGQEKVPVADDRFLARPVPRWTVENSRKGVPLADFEISRLALVLQILRLEPDGRIGKKLVARTDPARALEVA